MLVLSSCLSFYELYILFVIMRYCIFICDTSYMLWCKSMSYEACKWYYMLCNFRISYTVFMLAIWLLYMSCFILFYSQSVCHATFVHTYITFYISSILHVKRFIILHVIRFIWLRSSIRICHLFCIIQDMYVCHSRCKVTTKNPKNNGFQIRVSSL